METKIKVQKIITEDKIIARFCNVCGVQIEFTNGYNSGTLIADFEDKIICKSEYFKFHLCRECFNNLIKTFKHPVENAYE